MKIIYILEMRYCKKNINKIKITKHTVFPIPAGFFLLVAAGLGGGLEAVSFLTNNTTANGIRTNHNNVCASIPQISNKLQLFMIQVITSRITIPSIIINAVVMVRRMGAHCAHCVAVRFSACAHSAIFLKSEHLTTIYFFAYHKHVAPC